MLDRSQWQSKVDESEITFLYLQVANINAAFLSGWNWENACAIQALVDNIRVDFYIADASKYQTTVSVFRPGVDALSGIAFRF